MASQKSFGRRVLANLKKKWVQVFLCLVVFSGLVWGSARVFGPKAIDKTKATDASVYKYLICNECKLEILYNVEQENRTCPKCKPPNVGYLTPSKVSIKSGGDGNPWRRYNVAVVVEGVAFLALVYYLLSRPVEEAPQEYHVTCLHCGMLLRYKPDGLDKYAICPGCEQVIKLPDEEEAMTLQDQEHVKEDNILMTMEANLRSTGHIQLPPEEVEEAAHQPPDEAGG